MLGIAIVHGPKGAAMRAARGFGLHPSVLREVPLPALALPFPITHARELTFLRVQVDDAPEAAAWFEATRAHGRVGDVLLLLWLPESAREAAHGLAPCVACGRIAAPSSVDGAAFSDHAPGCKLAPVELAPIGGV